MTYIVKIWSHPDLTCCTSIRAGNTAAVSRRPTGRSVVMRVRLLVQHGQRSLFSYLLLPIVICCCREERLEVLEADPPAQTSAESRTGQTSIKPEQLICKGRVTIARPTRSQYSVDLLAQKKSNPGNRVSTRTLLAGYRWFFVLVDTLTPSFNKSGWLLFKIQLKIHKIIFVVSVQW